MNNLGKIAACRIKTARQAENFTQAELGDHLGISRDAVSKIENGHAVLGLRHLEVLSKVLNRPIEYFLGLDTGLTPDEEQVLATYRRLPATGQYRRIARRMLATMAQATEDNQE